ncbi:MAG: bifunctional DNA-formamidopyrimidine glycosylase/DNA-(apurinic or apyrimidinic site) lyase [Thermodesulfobacteriota bacterium]
MPELPEVEVIRQGLLPLVKNRRILAVSYSNKRLRKPFPRARMYGRVEKNFILDIERRGRYLLFRLTGKTVMIFHLGMTGKLTAPPADSPRRRHDHLRFLLDNGRELRFNDARRFGFVEVWGEEEPEALALFADFGPEPFDPAFDAQYLLSAAHGKTQSVKTFLMDNRVVTGIGNIYANEILFASRTHPATPAGRLSKLDWGLIARQSRMILEKAIQMGGSTISDYENADGKSGYFQLTLAVYGRHGESCPVCGSTIARLALAGRASFFCPDCQR